MKKIGLLAAALLSVPAALVPATASAAGGAFGDPSLSVPGLPPGNALHLPPEDMPMNGGTFVPDVPAPSTLLPGQADAAATSRDPADQAPGASPKSNDAKPGDGKPAAGPSGPVLSPADARAQTLDRLFKRLSVTNDDDEAKGIAAAIERLWLRTDSDTADLLMKRALTALNAKNYDLASQVLEKVVIIEPDWAEAWNKLATARYFADDDPGAMEDIDHVLTLEPRQFSALAGMGYILQRSGNDKGALQVFRKVLEIFPQQDDIKKLVQKLQYEVEGEPI